MALTVKQEKFCQAFIETGDASEAYRQSYNAGKMPPTSIHVKAHEVRHNVNVSLRIDELRAEAAERNKITVDDLVRELEEARVMAATGDKPQTASMVAATLGKAKLLGLSVDKVDMTSNGKEMAQFTFTPVGKND